MIQQIISITVATMRMTMPAMRPPISAVFELAPMVTGSGVVEMEDDSCLLDDSGDEADEELSSTIVVEVAVTERVVDEPNS
jgi:hypothetical protein